MREYLAFDNCVQAPHLDASKQEKAAVFVSSNAYYGYQQPQVYGTPDESSIQSMEDEGAPPVRLPCRKRHMENSTAAAYVNNDQWGECKKRRENDGGEYSQASSNGLLSNQLHLQNTQNHFHNNTLSTYQMNQPYNIPNIDNIHENGIMPNGDDHQMEVTEEGSSNNNNEEKHKKIESTHPRGRVKNYRLEEELLRETHGCTYYHWIMSNI